MAKSVKKEQPPTKAERPIIAIELPVAEVQQTTFGIHIDGDLTPRQSNALRRIAEGLNGKLGMFSTDGRVKNIHTIRWILEAAADRIDAVEAEASTENPECRAGGA